MRGIVFTLDATFALVLVMIFAGTLFAMLENFSQPDESLTLSRLARDVYEIRHYGATDTAAGVLEDDKCASAAQIGSAAAIVYGSISDNTKQSGISTTSKRVCLGV
jgi:hypothetical protein